MKKKLIFMLFAVVVIAVSAAYARRVASKECIFPVTPLAFLADQG